jgi:hypothetical protein
MWLSPSGQEHWFIYFGVIKPVWTDLQMTAGLALPGIERRLADAIEEGDLAAMRQLTDIRDKFKKEPPDTPVTTHLAEDEDEASALENQLVATPASSSRSLDEMLKTSVSAFQDFEV